MAEKGKKESKQHSYEEKVKKLEEIVRELEVGGASLEDSLTLFEEGSKLLADCKQILTASERRMEILLGDLGEITSLQEESTTLDDDGGQGI